MKNFLFFMFHLSDSLAKIDQQKMETTKTKNVKKMPKWITKKRKTYKKVKNFIEQNVKNIQCNKTCKNWKNKLEN